MSKTRYNKAVPHPARLGEWLRELREERELPLRAVAEAAGMDLAHLHKIELGQRVPTEAQTSRLARFFKLDETEAQARRIAEKFRQEFADNPAAGEAIGILAEEAAVYRTAEKGANPSPRPPVGGERAKASRDANNGKGGR